MRTTHSVRRHGRKHRRKAALYLSEKVGVPVSHRSLEAMPIPYQVINGYAIYDEADLDTHAEQMLSAPRRTGRVKRGAHPNSARTTPRQEVSVSAWSDTTVRAAIAAGEPEEGTDRRLQERRPRVAPAGRS
jgi:hypothetical protein